MAVPTLAFLAGSPPAAIELASVPWIGAQRHPQSDRPTGRPHVSTRANRGPSSLSEHPHRSAPTSASQNPRRNPHSARGNLCPQPTAISCLGAFRPPATSPRGETVIPAAENLHSSGRRSSGSAAGTRCRTCRPRCPCRCIALNRCAIARCAGSSTASAATGGEIVDSVRVILS